MQQPKWTPGPWRADWDDNGQWYVEPLGVTGHALRGDDGDCIERATAHLIAAAPELYEVLHELIGHLGLLPPQELYSNSCQYENAIGIWNRAATTLAKARGESDGK